MKQNKINEFGKQSYGESKLPSIQDNLTLPQNKLTINLQETEEKEVALTF